MNNPFDFKQAADGAARLAADNKTALTRTLGRPPTDAELYIAHQQGAGGAAALLSNPTATAAEALAPAYKGNWMAAAKAISDNGGDPNAPAATFTGMWAARFNGAAGAISNSRKASAYQDIASNPNLTEGARAHALQFVNQTIAAQQIAEEADAKARKAQNDQAANGYVQRMLKGDWGDMIGQIASDPGLTWETRLRLGDIAQDKAGDDTHKTETAYGPGFWQAYRQVLAGADDPSHISDFGQVLSLADRSTDPSKRLTVAGAEKLGQIMNQSRKSVDDTAVQRSKLGLLTYAKSKVSFNDEMLIPGVPTSMAKDPQGERIFNAQFIPRFEAAYDQWVKDKKNPWEFLTQENVDKMISGMRSSREMAEAKMRATNGLGDVTPPPPMPKGASVVPEAWTSLTEKPATLADGTPLTKVVWANALSTLATHPTPVAVEGFNRLFGRQDGAQLLKQLTGKDLNAPAAQPGAPAAPAAIPQPKTDGGAYFGGPRQRQSKDEVAAAEAEIAERTKAKGAKIQDDAKAIRSSSESLGRLAEPGAREKIAAVSDKNKRDRKIADLDTEEKNVQGHLARLAREAQSGNRVEGRKAAFEGRLQEIRKERTSVLGN